MNGARNVALPEQLCKLAEQKYAHRFGSIEELVAEMLRELVRDDAIKMDQNEAKIVEDRLKALGYV